MPKTSDVIWQDTQHQVLFALIDRLKDPGDAGMDILTQLSDYVAQHFHLEERYMELMGDPNRDAHRRQHRQFEKKIAQLRQSKTILAEGLVQPEFREQITRYLSRWLVNHVMGIDRTLERHILNSIRK